MMKNTIFILIFFYLCGCATQETALPQMECVSPNITTNKTVEEIFAVANKVASPYKYDDVIEAYVVSTDENGNFFKSISFQTLATASKPAIGFSVPVDVTNTYVDYRLGNKVYIKLKDQYLDILYGGLRIGSLSVNSLNQGGVGRISQNDYKKVLLPSCSTLADSFLTKSITLDLINDTHLNTLIELSNVQFSAEAIGKHYYESVNDVGGATNWPLEDASGNKIFFRTSSYAAFSAKTVPSGSGNVKGILTKYGTDYQLLSRSEGDISLAQSRKTPLFSENFESVTDNTNLNLPGWANIVQAGSLYWFGTVYSGNGYAEYGISGTKVVSNIGWLITPKIDLSLYKKVILSFRSAQHHLAVDSPLNSLEVLVSTNFDGLNVATATWVPLTANFPKQATPWYQFVASGAVDLSSYTGKIHIAFKYTGSGKTVTLDGSFMLDDVQIYGEK